MPSLVILGASGFLGKAIIEQNRGMLPIKAIVRKKKAPSLTNDLITWHEVDLLTPHSLDNILEKEDIVINTTYIPTNSKSNNLLLIRNILTSCTKNKVRRLIHCSTADVVGSVNPVQIDESVICNPLTKYERVKFSVEEYILNTELNGVEIIILRPSAMVGPGGKNLVKLAESLIHGNKLVNYLRASLFRNRRMHLVPVNNVAKAILHLSSLKNVAKSNIYFISSDDDLENNFYHVEKHLLTVLGLKNRKIPLLPIPCLFLSILLRIKGRAHSNLSRIYLSNKLMGTHFIPSDSLHDAISRFGQAYLREKSKGVENAK